MARAPPHRLSRPPEHKWRQKFGRVRWDGWIFILKEIFFEKKISPLPVWLARITLQPAYEMPALKPFLYVRASHLSAATQGLDPGLPAQLEDC